MPQKPKSIKQPSKNADYRELPSDGWPELIMFLPNRLIQIYCKIRKIDKISTLDATVIVILAFFLLVSLFFIANNFSIL